MLLLRESELFQYFVEIGKPLPFSLSTLQKDRLDGRLGVPYRPLGGGIFTHHTMWKIGFLAHPQWCLIVNVRHQKIRI